MLSPFVVFAEKLADEAAKMITAYRGNFGTSIKADKTFVTDLDLAIEKRLRQMLAERFPDHGIYGEEFGTQGLNAEWVWTLDPIDGTMAMVAGMPVYSTLIALARNGTPVIGVMHFPASQERWIGVSGKPTTCNGVVCHTRLGEGLRDAIQSASNPDFFTSIYERNALAALSSCTAWRVFGGAAMSYGRLAAGRIDVAIDAGLKVYDYAPFVPVIEGAGGVISDWNGNPLTIHSGSRVLAAGDARRHLEALNLIRSLATEGV